MILTVTANAAIDKRYVVESFETGSVNRVSECVYSAGGKGLNVSRVAAIAGEQVLATGFLGGHAGRYIEEKLGKSGIGSDFVWCDGESRSCINIWDQQRHVQTEFLEPGFVIGRADEEALENKFEELLDQCAVATISGSVPKGGTSDLYKNLLKIGEKHDKKVILDTSGSLLSDCIDSHPFMIKPNIDEIRMLLNEDVDPANHDSLMKAADKLHQRGIRCVVISLGSEGSVMSSPEGCFSVKVPKIDAVNTVGCGDAMIGGFAAGLSRGLPLPECLKLASGISTASAMVSETGAYRPEDFEKIVEEIRISRL